MRTMGDFTNTLLAGLGPDLIMPPEVVRLMRWLEEDQNNLLRYTSTQDPFLPTTPVAGIDALWSHLAFVIDPDMFKYWLGREGLENTLVSILRCGGDGSHIGLWRDPQGAVKFVFAGSEGEAFVLAETGIDFVRIITMGYESIEIRETLDDHPGVVFEEYSDGPWPDTAQAKTWVRDTFGVTYPDTAAELLPTATPDPFVAWVNENNQN